MCGHRPWPASSLVRLGGLKGNAAETGVSGLLGQVVNGRQQDHFYQLDRNQGDQWR